MRRKGLLADENVHNGGVTEHRWRPRLPVCLESRYSLLKRESSTGENRLSGA
jgi:hypothetical protein